MTLDSSAVIAILFGEFGHLDLIDQILEADHVRIGAPALLETSIVFEARGGKKSVETVGGLLAELGVSVVPFGEAEYRLAIDAFRRFGRGRHPAGLNFGDCFSYATAAAARDTLLYVGDDFAKATK
jgi:ribonuclease VapC